jgi:hypothetical protein
MGKHRVEISGGAAGLILAGVFGAVYLFKPADLWRNPALELGGLIGVVRTYEAHYRGCPDGSDSPGADPAGFALAFAGVHGYRFPAWDDAAAIRFARNAKPDCELWSLDHRRRHYFDASPGLSKRRRVPLDGG